MVALGTSSFAAFAGCSIDTRDLHPGSAWGQAGSEQLPLLNAGSAGSATGLNDAGTAGSSLPGGCPDINGNGVGDCLETLLKNGDFKADIESWTPDSETQLTWDESNASADLPSGSALLSGTSPENAGAKGAALRIASQCVAIAGKQLVTVYANAFVASGQAPDGHAEIDVNFFDTAACAGTSVSSFSTPQPLEAAKDQWLTLRAGSVSGPNTQSALVELALSQPLSAAPFSARFDNVLLQKQPL
jgi:hypothetical protein